MSTENEGRQIIQTCFFETHIPLRNGDYSEGIFQFNLMLILLCFITVRS